jgi:uncharacterized protein YqhQ
MDDNIINYGGQAVIEGVMMRGKSSLAIAMRDPTGKIVTYTEPLGGIYKSYIAKIPFLRGLILLWDSLGLGMKTLTISANTQSGEDAKIEGPTLYITLGITMVVALGVFFLVPAGIGYLFDRFLNLQITWIGNLVEGFVRLIFLIGYIWAVGFMPDIKRVFGYHGAEHKTINAYESGAELTPENVAGYSVQHPRCGTAFLLTLALLSVIIFTILGPLPLFWKMVSRILLIPVIAGISYEYIRWTAKHLNSPLVRALIKPNLALQSLTTREPDLQMLEVAITAFNTMKASEELVA